MNGVAGHHYDMVAKAGQGDSVRTCCEKHSLRLQSKRCIKRFDVAMVRGLANGLKITTIKFEKNGARCAALFGVNTGSGCVLKETHLAL
jgi:hypothetical protein